MDKSTRWNDLILHAYPLSCASATDINANIIADFTMPMFQRL